MFSHNVENVKLFNDSSFINQFSNSQNAARRGKNLFVVRNASMTCSICNNRLWRKHPVILKNGLLNSALFIHWEKNPIRRRQITWRVLFSITIRMWIFRVFHITCKNCLSALDLY